MSLILALFVGTVALSGCYGPPVRSRTQPPLIVRVVDSSRQPVVGASVSYFVFGNPNERFRGERKQQTDHRGVARFEEVTKWEGVLLPIMYGSYMQGWCVEADSYEVEYGVLPRSRSDEILVKLAPRKSNLGCNSVPGKGWSAMRGHEVTGDSRLPPLVDDGRMYPQ